jgi:hypothetical protein
MYALTLPDVFKFLSDVDVSRIVDNSTWLLQVRISRTCVVVVQSLLTLLHNDFESSTIK